MMNQSTAIAYGKRIGVKYYVKNNYGGLMGGYVHRKDAEKARDKWQAEKNPWNPDVKYFVVKA